ncbi:MAG: hypothetical protein Q8O67_31980 [Deltaproteobacteria bacterium]|nr:hypothetical protein [Deltaproteobacteria bacterium]
MKFLAVVVSAVSACAHNPQAAAIQQTAVGGGLVAVGSVAAAGVLVGGAFIAASASTPAGKATAEAATLPLLVASAVDVAVIITGAVMMGTAASGLTSPQLAPSPAARIQPVLPEPPARALTFAALSSRLATARSEAGVLIRTDGATSCKQATLIIDGVEVRMPREVGGEFLLSSRELDLAKATYVSLNLCTTTLDLTAGERAGIGAAILGTDREAARPGK